MAFNPLMGRGGRTRVASITSPAACECYVRETKETRGRRRKPSIKWRNKRGRRPGRAEGQERKMKYRNGPKEALVPLLAIASTAKAAQSNADHVVNISPFLSLLVRAERELGTDFLDAQVTGVLC